MEAARLSGLERLAIAVETAFVLNSAGRILHANDPPRSAGPRFFIKGCAEGNRFLFRHDVSDAIAEKLEMLAREEPPLAGRDSVPVHTAEYAALLETQSPVTRQEIELDYELPNDLDDAHDVRIVRSGTAEGDALIANLAANGVPEGLREMGFKDETEFWEPWCVAFQGLEIATVAFAARLSEKGAASGVATAKAFRGRGLAAAAVAAWTRHPRLRCLMLGYSHNRDNRSSERVAERLGLRFFGVHAAIA